MHFLHLEIKEIEKSKEIGNCEQAMWYVCDEYFVFKEMESIFQFDRQVNKEANEQSLPI